MILETAYLTLTLLMTLVLIRIGFYAINQSTLQTRIALKSKLVLVTAFILWHTYLYFISMSGILTDFESMPPRLPLLVIIPLFLFSGIFVYRNRKKNWVHIIPKSWLVYYQSLRIGIETIFYFSVGAGILPELVTFAGYNYDILFGISALVMGYLVFFKKSLSLTAVKYWNIIGLLIIAFIIFLFISGTYFPQVYNQETSVLTPDFTQYPYILVAGFLMPSAVFIHFLSLAQNKELD